MVCPVPVSWPLWSCVGQHVFVTYIIQLQVFGNINTSGLIQLVDGAPSAQISRLQTTLNFDCDCGRLVQSRTGRRAVPGHGVGRVCTLPRQQAAARDWPRPAQAEAPQRLGGRTLGLAALHTLAAKHRILYRIISYLLSFCLYYVLNMCFAKKFIIFYIHPAVRWN